MRNHPLVKNRRRGAAILWFLVVAWPIFVFGGALALDFSRIITVSRQMSNVTESAALAGAQEFQRTPCGAGCVYYETYLNKDQARNATGAYLERAKTLLAPSNNIPSDFTTDVAVTAGDQPTVVTVTTRYTVDGLLFSRFFGQGDFEGVVTKQAFVCNTQSPVLGPTDGNCTRPPAQTYDP
jgi:Flp pilus assembly protein TadG